MKTGLRLSVCLAVAFTGLLVAGCAGRTAHAKPDPRFIAGVTSGEISRRAPLKIVFTDELGEERGTVLASSPLFLSPRVRGSAAWIDRWTLQFTPERPLRPGSDYRVDFDPARAGIVAQKKGEPMRLADVPPFSFTIHVVGQSVSLVGGELIAPNPQHPESMEYTGNIVFSDPEQPEVVPSVLRAELGSRRLTVGVDGTEVSDHFTYHVAGIERTKEAQHLSVSWSGEALSTKQSGHRNIIVPSRDLFSVLDVHPNLDSERSVEVVFSDPLKGTQSLDGLISSPSLSNLKFIVQSNRVKIYSTQPFPKSIEIDFNPSILSSSGTALAQATTRTVVFPTEKPQVRFVGTGVIVPTTQGVTVPIETMNLNAIMVEAIQVYGSNVHQFLQVNQLDENNEIERVGEVAWRKVIQLGWKDENLDHWVRYGLDLSPLLRRDPGALYQLRVTFRKPHIQYPGPGGGPVGAAAPAPSADEVAFAPEVTGPNQTAEASSWDAYGGNHSYEYRRHRTDPLHPAYYETWYDHNINATRNVMVSNIGLIAQQGESPALDVFAADLRDTSPMAGVSVTVFNYQRRALGQGVTDGSGIAKVSISGGDPFLLVAKKEGQLGYLRVDDQSVLSVSHFDTGGVVPKNGMQGFIYGERGVWRPGDSMYLTLILDDAMSKLAVGHPVGFELRDPRGTVVDHEVIEYAPSGFYSLRVATQPDAPTGSWSARFYVGGQTYDKSLRVESVMPNRLKITLDFGGPELSGPSFRADLASQWLHGAIAGNLKADVNLSLSPSATTFPGYPEFSFDDPTRQFESEPQTVFEGTLDAAGKAQISTPLEVSNAPGKLTATVTTRVFEPGGAFSTEYVAIPYSPYERYVGVRLPKGDVARGILRTDENQRADIVMMNTDGSLAGRARVRVELYKLSWRWWWETDSENLAGYVTRNSLRPIQSQTVDLVDGKGAYSFQIKYPEWGRFMIRVTDPTGGHSAARIFYADWPGWAGHGQEDSSQGVAMLTLTVEKPKYNVGDMVSVTFPSTADGRALATVEANGKIVSGEWVTPSADATAYRFRASADMAPTAYLHLSYLQPHLQTANDRPIRAYGIVPISVEDPSTHLAPTISTTDEFRPGDRVRITVGEQGRRAMTYTLAVVDEGLLGITRYATPNPWTSFYQRRASTVKSWDLYGYVAGAFSGQLSTLLAIGGSDEGRAGGERRVNRFEPVVLFFNPTTIAAGESHTHEFVMPQYVGAVRVMVVAGDRSAYGSAEKSVPVRTPLMVLGTLPRVIGPGEEMEVPVTLFALDASVRAAEVSIAVDGPLEVVGRHSDSLRLNAPGETETSFTLRAGNTVGAAHIRLAAGGGGSSAAQAAEIAVRLPQTPQVTVDSLTLRSGESVQRAVRLFGIPGTNTLTIEASRVPPLDLSRRLGYLITYPHGCIEQTTSSVFPQLNLDIVTQLTPDRVAEIQSNIRAAIDRLLAFQTTSGGFSFWPGEPEANEWGTCYAGDFLLSAKARGYTIPDALLSGWLAYQGDKANRWRSGETLTQAYRLYTLALSGSPDLASMNRMRESRSLDDRTKWRLALAYLLVGQNSAADALISGAGTSVGSYAELSGTFGSDLRDEAMILESLIALGRDAEAGNVARRISSQLTSDASWSTQSLAYALKAMSTYALTQGSGEGVSLSYRWQGGPEKSIASAKPFLTADVDTEGLRTGTLAISNTSGATLFPRIIARGVPSPGDEVSTASGISLSIEYFDENGKPTTPDRIRAGEDFRVLVDVSNRSRTRSLQNLALSHLVPSGWEIQNTRLSGGLSESPYTYRDIRDDRVDTYFDLKAGESKRFTLLANAAYRGRFYLPAVTCEAMYDPSIHATVKGQWVIIDKSSTQP